MARMSPKQIVQYPIKLSALLIMLWSTCLPPQAKPRLIAASRVFQMNRGTAMQYRLQSWIDNEEE